MSPSGIEGEVRIPGSKSHTIRGVVIGTLAEGTSVLRDPLDAADTRSAAACCRGLGAAIETEAARWKVRGCGGCLPSSPVTLDVGNSGTTLGNLLAVCATGTAPVKLDGDASIRTRPFGPLLASLEALGAKILSAGPSGTAPITLCGPLCGGEAEVDGTTSIYLTPLLVACPLAPKTSRLRVRGRMNEQGYVRMTLDWLAASGIRVEANEDLTRLEVPGGQIYGPVDRAVAADFSTAAFPACAAVLAAQGNVVLRGLDFSDTQGDKVLFDILRRMGATFEVADRQVIVRPGASLRGTRIDLSGAPDALPVLAVVACAAEGETILENVAMARIKETDRIAVMREELTKMGADVEELPDGLAIRKSALHGAVVDGRDDHRVVMALAVAGLIARGETCIESAEAVEVTYPTFVSSMRSLG
ncbi:MAG: 3-phosphoshikimate 1-carboxyvinyltransferase, partial [Candidatus Bipolaricaulota bacterium]